MKIQDTSQLTCPMTQALINVLVGRIGYPDLYPFSQINNNLRDRLFNVRILKQINH